jgi:hypothetical protein
VIVNASKRGGEVHYGKIAAVRLFFAIPHFYDPEGGRGYGSMGPDPEPRIAALTATIGAVLWHFGPRQYVIDWAQRLAHQANDVGENVVDITVCTTQGKHILDQLPIPASAYTHAATTAEPMMLGFECQAVLRDVLGEYDYYCFLEDDTVIRDSWFFSKLAWFTDQYGHDALLQPNRYAVDFDWGGRKGYGGNVRRERTDPFQNIDDTPALTGEVMGRKLVFRRAINPNAACYFLTEEQMKRWAGRPYFLDRDTSFAGPIESAASLGIMRTFKIYKPAAECANFLEVEHFGTTLWLVEKESADDLPPIALKQFTKVREARREAASS